MNKKVSIPITLAVLIAVISTAFIIWKSKKVSDNENNAQPTIAVPAIPVKPVDEDVKAIEDEFSTIDKDNFNIDDLSDANLGI